MLLFANLTMPGERSCPYCKKPAGWENNPWRPFCSERCKMTDLELWAMGKYKIAGEKISKGDLAGDGECDEEEKTKRDI